MTFVVNRVTDLVLLTLRRWTRCLLRNADCADLVVDPLPCDYSVVGGRLILPSETLLFIVPIVAGVVNLPIGLACYLTRPVITFPLTVDPTN